MIKEGRLARTLSRRLKIAPGEAKKILKFHKVNVREVISFHSSSPEGWYKSGHWLIAIKRKWPDARLVGQYPKVDDNGRCSLCPIKE